MADGYRYTQQAGNLFYLLHTPQNSLPTEPHLSSLLSHFNHEPPSPSKSPDPGAVGHSSQGMYNQNHQQGHNPRINGNSARTLSNLMQYNYHSTSHQQVHSQHHQGIQPDHGSHSGNTSAMGHHGAYTGGVLGNANVFTNGLQNGHNSASRGGQTQQYNEHWQEQLRLFKESEAANTAMTEHSQVNYYARLKANENKGIGAPSPTANNSSVNIDGETEDLRRPYNVEKSTKRQDWNNLDLSGQGLRALSTQLFAYTFLHELYIASNRLESLPPAIGELRNLNLLEASHNQIRELPVELGMCTFLRNLNLFNNNITTLPCELGSLHNLEMLGIEGNPLNPELKSKIQEQGTKSLIKYLREQTPGECLRSFSMHIHEYFLANERNSTT